MKLRFTHFIPAIIWFGISLFLFTLPGSSIPKNDLFDKLQVDKWVHITIFFLLCFLFGYPLRKFNSKNLLPLLFTICLLGIAYGIAVEFIQKYWIPNRSFDVWDIMADTIGCIIAFFWLKRKRKQKVL